MKKLFASIIFLQAALSVTAQNNDKYEVSIVYGSLGFIMKDLSTPDMGFHSSLDYQKKITKRLAYGAFISFARHSTYPVFFDDPQKLDAYLISQRSNIGMSSGWRKSVYASAGTKLFFAPVHTRNVYVSAYMGLGLTLNYKSDYYVPDFTIDLNTGRVVSYTGLLTEKTEIPPFFMPGIFIHFTCKQKYIIGIDANRMYTFSQSGYDSISLVAGVKF